MSTLVEQDLAGVLPREPRWRTEAPNVRGAMAAPATCEGTYDLITFFECLHDMSRPVEALKNARRLVGDEGAVIVMDERVAEDFKAPGDEIDRMMYGWSIVQCLPGGMANEPTAATGTVMRPSTLRRYALEAGFAGVEVLPIDNDPMRRWYRLIA